MLKIILILIAITTLLSSAEKPTSLTDTPSYHSFCTIAVNNDLSFQQFRSLEYHDKTTAERYFRYIESHYPALTHMWDLFRMNDSIGMPLTDKIGTAGPFSTATLGYAKIAGDLNAFFGPLDKLKIVEIGGGYGGQCRILMQVFGVKDYTIIDLPEPLALAKKYLAQFGLTNVKFLTPDQVGIYLNSDLLISNFAFSECRSEIQINYMQQVIQYARQGYMLCNFDQNSEVIPMKPKMLCAKLRELHSTLQVLAEDPKIAPCNWLCIWREQ